MTPPTPIFPAGNIFMSKELVNDSNISGLDSQQLDTATLHASLVSEILALRREVGSKHEFIERLEDNLESVKAENDTLQETLSKHAKESRVAKRQLHSVEVGSSSAIDDLCKERDDANEANVELRKRLEGLQRKVRNQDEDAKQTYDAWGKERLLWGDEKRLLERKVLIAEGRLKSIVEEIATYQIATSSARKLNGVVHRRHRSSMSSIGSIRSVFDLRQYHANGSSSHALSLAEELNLGNDEDEAAGEMDDCNSAHEVKLRKANGVKLSLANDEVARELLSLISSSRVSMDSMDLALPVIATIIEPRPVGAGKVIEVGPRKLNLEYVDTAAQHYSAQSHELHSTSTAGSYEEPGVYHLEVEANQRRKRDPVTSKIHIHTRAMSVPLSTELLVSLEKLQLLPPLLKSSEQTSAEVGQVNDRRSEFISSSTQTEQYHEHGEPRLPPPTRCPPPLPISVPSIAIHPPTSRPSSPKVTLLPPGTRNVGCQTVKEGIISRRSIAVQTEGIRVDKRPIKLPPHLLPSALAAESRAPEVYSLHKPKDLSPVRENVPDHDMDKTRINYRIQDLALTYKRPTTPLGGVGEEPDRLGNDSDAEEGGWSRLKRKFMPNNRFADPGVNELEPDAEDLHFSDGDYESYALNSGTSKRLNKHSRLAFDPPTPVPENEKVTTTGRPTQSRSQTSAGSRSSLEKPSRTLKSQSFSNGGRQHGVRRPFGQGDTNASTHRSRTPSIGSVASSSNFSKTSGPPPPFAIPVRGSSVPNRRRNEQQSSPTPGSDPASPGRARDGRLPVRKPTLRKAHSAAMLPGQKGPQILRSKIPTGLGTSSHAPSGAHLPPLPISKLPSNSDKAVMRPSTAKSHDFSMSSPTGNASVGSSAQPSAVDAITAAMIGEWMWKYVRKRKSFGGSNSAQDFAKTGDARHKRWVWLSPYERTIMWSSKQPNSNATLTGKSRRKCKSDHIYFTARYTDMKVVSIQSVLDVVDDTPLPKGSNLPTVFKRSIIVLTPSRALKFTTMSKERHYVWLTALSFLAHHTSHGVPDLTGLPAPTSLQENDSHTNSRATSVRRNPMRLTRDKPLSRPSSRSATPTMAPTNLVSYPRNNVSTAQDTAFAPHVPSVPTFSRNRSITNPTRGRPTATSSVRSQSMNVSSNHSMLSASSSTRARSPPRPPSAQKQGHNIEALHVENSLQVRESSPRPSDVSAEFGGNQNFFDAVGMVRMDAFVNPGFMLNTAPVGAKAKTGRGLSQAESSQDGARAPPNFRQGRQLRRKTGFLSGFNKQQREVFGEL